MTKFIARALLLILAAAATIAWPQLHGAAPNFVFLMVLAYAFRDDSHTYLWFALLGGLLLDAYASSAFGAYAVCFLLIGLVIQLATETLFRSESRSPLYLAAAVAVSNVLLITLLYAYNALAMRWEHGLLPLSPLYLTHSAWLAIILNLIAAAPIYLIASGLESLIARYNRPQNTIR